MPNPAISNAASVDETIRWQADHARQAGAPCTARVVLALLPLQRTDTLTGRRIASWQANLRDAMALRVAGGLHHLVLSGTDTRLAAVYSGALTNQSAIDRLVSDIVARNDAVVAPWLDGPPQTNEAGRSASVMAGLSWLSARLGPRFSLIEIGASAGINTMMDRYRYDLGGASFGPPDSPMYIAPEWRGARAPDAPVNIASIAGCDLAPIDLSDRGAALRLKSYVWPEATERMTRIDAAIAVAAERAAPVVQESAGDFAERMFGTGREHGATRALFHTIVWQYLPDAEQDRITDIMMRAGAEASANSPVAWLALETNRQTFEHELTVRYWPGGEEPAILATAHPHGAWVKWL